MKIISLLFFLRNLTFNNIDNCQSLFQSVKGCRFSIIALKKLLTPLLRFYAQACMKLSDFQKINPLTGCLFGSAGRGAGEGGAMARGLGTVRLNSFG